MVYTGIDPAEHVVNDYIAIWCRYDCSDILRDNMNIHSSDNELNFSIRFELLVFGNVIV